ncbi:MAG: monofunctional biosynthetic peptidoglycan transglycosylase [Flavobacterium sp.]|nr:monofunctional biosynthetic peptidoglycan transglycosylase [Flavobacterium sp.]
MIYKLLKFAIYSITAFIVSTVLIVVLFKWVNPASSAFMLLKSSEPAFLLSNEVPRQKWVSIDKISRNMPLAIIASEDQLFFDHYGFDFDQIEKAMKANAHRKRQRGASTISQQVAKNMFLFPGKSIFRKAMEAYFTLLIELIWGKKRILEVYMNIAELGEDIYGVEAAAKLYFNKNASAISPGEAALLTAILPSPVKRSVLRPTAYLSGRKETIMKQMELIGGVNYIKEMID